MSSHSLPSSVFNRGPRIAFDQVQFSEKYNQQQGRFNVELVALREQLNEAETHKELLQRELQQVREKLDASRIESMNDSEETISELRKRHDREMQIVMDDNQKLITELDMLSEQNRRFHNDRMQTDSEYEELRTKRSAILQWERQISEVIPYISDKNDALAFLQALASKMGEELEFMKHSSKFCYWIRLLRYLEIEKSNLCSLRCIAFDNGQKLAKPEVAKAGQNGIAEFAELVAERNSSQGGHLRGIESNTS